MPCRWSRISAGVGAPRTCIVRLTRRACRPTRRSRLPG